jgi:hypothetical protein
MKCANLLWSDLGQLTSGQAAQLCGKGRADFLLSLPRVGVSLSNLRPEDADAELDFIRQTTLAPSKAQNILFARFSWVPAVPFFL